MMKSIEQLKKEQAAELVKLAYELKVAESMPITPDRVMQTGRGAGEPWVTYKVQGIRPVIDLIRAFVVVPMSVLKDGFTTVKPVELMKAEKRDDADGEYACAIEVNQGSGFGPTVKIVFFARVADVGLVRICADVNGPEYIGNYSKLGASVSEQRDARTGRISARTYSANNLLYGLTDNRICWASGDIGPIKTGANISYYLCADQCADLPGAEQSHALGQLTNLCDLLEPIQPDAES